MKTLFIFGTRPEAIKLAPLIRCLREDPNFDVQVAVTAQHREMLDQVLEFFSISVDYDLDLMTHDQSLSQLTSRALSGLQPVFEDAKPEHVIVQGDTTTTMVGALAAFYHRCKVSHVEAGLRSGSKQSPYPEEVNRILTGHLADFHFPPTERARQNLKFEGITDWVWVVGNTAIDALLTGVEIVKAAPEGTYESKLPKLDFAKRLVLVTGHRRESFGEGLRNIAAALRSAAANNPDCEFVYPVHPNPNVTGPVHELLGDAANIHLIDPLDYPTLIWLMDKSYLVLTDSGGIQEEAPTLGKPVLVTREVTERTEGVECGTARLVGTDRAVIEQALQQLLDDDAIYEQMSQAGNPYGDGTTSRQIQDVLRIHGV